MSTQRFFDVVRPMHGSGGIPQSVVDVYNTFIEEAKRRRVGAQKLAYILATVKHETGGTFMPVRETFAGSDEQAIRRLENAFSRGQLPWVKTRYWDKKANGHSYFGRGYVQITHDYNYKRLGDLLGIDLLNNPHWALHPQTAMAILFEGMVRGLFTGRSLDDVSEPATSAPNFVNDRVVVNGKDRAAKIASYANVYWEALRDVDLLEQSRTMQAVRAQEKSSTGGVIAGTGAAIGSAATAVNEIIGEPATLQEAAGSATFLSHTFPIAASILSVVAIAVFVYMRIKAKKIAEARRDDAEKGVR